MSRASYKLQLAPDDVWRAKECRKLAGKSVRVPSIIRIEKGHPAAPRCTDAHISRGRHAGIGLADQAEPRILYGCDGLASRVGRTIVHDDHLEILERLSKDRADGAMHISGFVLQRDDHADRRGRRVPRHSSAPEIAAGYAPLAR